MIFKQQFSINLGGMASMINWNLKFYAIPGIPMVKTNDDIGQIIFDSAEKNNFKFKEGDVIIVAIRLCQ